MLLRNTHEPETPPDFQLAPGHAQRRLEELVIRQQIRAKGESTSTIYVPAAETGATQQAESDYVPLTAQGTIVRDLVRRPLIERPPVGYNADWLHD